MEFNEIDKNKVKSKSIKYFTKLCSNKMKETLDTKEWLKIEEILYSKKNLKILKGLVDSRNNAVIKVGDRDTIEKEYKLGKALNNIDGFIKYFCYFSCNKEFKMIDIKQSLCETKGDATKVLVMSYYEDGSIGKFNWNKSNFNTLKSIIKQIFISLYLAFIQYGFIHNDTHLDNFLLEKYNKKNLLFNDYKLVMYDYKVIIMDFENALIDKNKKEYHILYLGFLQILNEIKFALKINVDNITDLLNYIELHMKLNKELDINNLLQLIDFLEFNSKIELKKFIYDPNVF